jgi:hypothetical protein
MLSSPHKGKKKCYIEKTWRLKFSFSFYCLCYVTFLFLFAFYFFLSATKTESFEIMTMNSRIGGNKKANTYALIRIRTRDPSVCASNRINSFCKCSQLRRMFLLKCNFTLKTGKIMPSSEYVRTTALCGTSNMIYCHAIISKNYGSSLNNLQNFCNIKHFSTKSITFDLNVIQSGNYIGPIQYKLNSQHTI